MDTSPPPYYPKLTIVVPAHNEDVVAAQTYLTLTIVWSCFYLVDNCSDNTYAECLSVQAMPEYAGRNLTIIDRTGMGEKYVL